ncbi:MAG: helix-turn-helix domain-containing protein [Verrucomicrobiota bacterium]
MQSIGERLEDARKRKGISLREAAEATKIRSDFLGSIEQNKFDFELPDIYKAGFIKNYARYLKLDAEKIIADYSAQQLSNSRLGKKNSGAEWFGSMELKENEKVPTAEADSGPEKNSGNYGRISAKPKPSTAPDEDLEEADESDKIFYIKVGLIFVGTLALVFVLFGLIRAILGSGSDVGDDSPVPATETPPAAEAPADITEAASTAVSSDQITLIAEGNVYVVVKQQEDDAVLFRQTMSEGESIPVPKSGPVDILFTAGENLVIEHGGERLRPRGTGTAKITVP